MKNPKENDVIIVTGKNTDCKQGSIGVVIKADNGELFVETYELFHDQVQKIGVL